MKAAFILLVFLTSPILTHFSADSTAINQVDLAGEKTVFLVRHGETCLDQGRDPELSPFGAERANELSRVLMDVDLDIIYSTPFNRTEGTAGPIAASRDMEVMKTPIASGFLESMADEIKQSEASSILVAGHSNTTPALVNLLIGTELEDLTEFDFDRLYIVTLREDGTGSYISVRYGMPSGRPEAC